MFRFSTVNVPAAFAAAMTVSPTPLSSSLQSASPTRSTTSLIETNGDGSDQTEPEAPSVELTPTDPSAFCVGVLGDLHIDPRKMDDYAIGRKQWLEVFEKERSRTKNLALVSLGDLGESKNCDHNEENPDELFAGTTKCHELAAEYLSSFDGIPYEVIGGNHDLEGIDEFRTDAENLAMFCRVHNKPTPQFAREIADKTALVGLCSTVFRDAQYTSHEVIIDDEQIEWFENYLQAHPASEGWKIFVFTHAPPNGSGLRVLQENHVINGCCWLNHSDEERCRKFIELVREHRSVKGWFSGHFHLGQDYQDSITFPNDPREDGPSPNRGSCVFAQTSVMRAGTSRDGRQQSRLLRGNKDGFEICTVDHEKDGAIRLDATVTYSDDSNDVGVYVHPDISLEHEDYFKVRMPEAKDEERCNTDDEDSECILTDCPIDEEVVSWWRLNNGRVLGMANGMLLEYDRSTLAPLGLVVSADELIGKKIAIIDSGIDACKVDYSKINKQTSVYESEGFETCEQAVVMYDDDYQATVIQPNEDGSYWRKIVRNKIARMQERRREKAALEFIAKNLEEEESKAKEKVQSSWGPYTTTSGVAKSTVVPGMEPTTPDSKSFVAR